MTIMVAARLYMCIEKLRNDIRYKSATQRKMPYILLLVTKISKSYHLTSNAAVMPHRAFTSINPSITTR